MRVHAAKIRVLEGVSDEEQAFWFVRRWQASKNHLLLEGLPHPVAAHLNFLVRKAYAF